MNAREHAESADPVRREYDSLAPVYDRRWRAYIDATLELVLAGLELAGSERVLDALWRKERPRRRSSRPVIFPAGQARR